MILGSRIMHLIIANRIADSLSIKEKNNFLIGGIAPDAVNSKELSHFFRGKHSNYSRYIDYQEFIEKYHSTKKNSYILGYYAHLIADDLWLQGFYTPWLKNRIEADKNILNAYHDDFRLLNGKLLAYYGEQDKLKDLLSASSEIVDLEEVPEKNIQKFLPYVLEDMEFEKNAISEDLNVFTLDQIIGYIETAVGKGIININSLLKWYSFNYSASAYLAGSNWFN